MELDTSKPKHAAAYLLAAGHFLSSTAEYSGQELEYLLNIDEDEASEEDLARRSKIVLWKVFDQCAFMGEDPHLCFADLIESLAIDILTFSELHQ